MKTRILKSSSKTTEKGAFPLLYPYGDEHHPSDLVTYLESKRRRSTSASDDPEDVNKRQLQSFTWTEQSQRRLYTADLLLESGNVFQMWLLHTATRIKYLRLKFLESEPTSRIASGQELE